MSVETVPFIIRKPAEVPETSLYCTEGNPEVVKFRNYGKRRKEVVIKWN
jgi:hypothetical protein